MSSRAPARGSSALTRLGMTSWTLSRTKGGYLANARQDRMERQDRAENFIKINSDETKRPFRLAKSSDKV